MIDIMLLKAINYKMPQDAKLKQRLKEEGSQLVTNCHQLKRKSPKDGKDKAVTVYPYSKGRYLKDTAIREKNMSMILLQETLMAIYL